MRSRPTLRTHRLTLRPFVPGDAAALKSLASAYEVALNTISVPHPYPDGAAEAWIATHEDAFVHEGHQHFAIDDGQLVGTIGLMMRKPGIAELGYWVGVPFWRRGYATEAGAEVVRFGFEELGLQRIYARHATRNPASGRVMQKLGMTQEGTLRRHEVKWGEYLDVACYGILLEEWIARTVRTDR